MNMHIDVDGDSTRVGEGERGAMSCSTSTTTCATNVMKINEYYVLLGSTSLSTLFSSIRHSLLSVVRTINMKVRPVMATNQEELQVK